MFQGNALRSFLWLCFAFAVAKCQQGHPFGGYQHNIPFPSITGQFHASTLNNQQPVQQLSAGFRLNPPPPLPFLQSFPLNPRIISAVRSSFQENNFSRDRFLGAPQKNLFTPNTIRQKPQSEEQEEEYRKYLKEEAEELEKEREQNEITTDFGDFIIESTTSLQPNQKTFVRLNVDGKDYSYST